jgi:hypothetical protein
MVNPESYLPTAIRLYPTSAINVTHLSFDHLSSLHLPSIVPHHYGFCIDTIVFIHGARNIQTVLPSHLQETPINKTPKRLSFGKVNPLSLSWDH